MPALFDQLHQDHINYSRLLNLLEINLQRMADGEKTDYLIMQDILKYMINYPDMYHHPTEELLFKELGRVEGKDAANIKRLYEEHELLADLAQRLEDQLQNASSGHVVSKDEILELGNQYLDTMRNHVMLEEREVFPLLEANLSRESWERVENEVSDVSDPMFSDAVSDEYQRLFKSITERKSD